MKKSFLSFALLFPSVYLFSQLYGPAWADPIGGNSSLFIPTIAVNPNNGDFYTTGDFYGTPDFDPGSGVTELESSATDAYIAKYNSSGALLWVISFSSNGEDFNNIGRDIVYKDGSIYAYGHFGGTVDFDPGEEVYEVTAESSHDLYIVKLDENGNFDWVSTISSETVILARGLDVDTSENGGIFISGSFQGLQQFDPNSDDYTFTSTFQEDGYLCKFDLDGNFIWAITMRSHLQCNVEDVIASNAGDGHCFIGGQFFWDLDVDTSSNELFVDEDDDNSIEGFVAEIDENGQVVWYKIIYSSDVFSLNSMALVQGPQPGIVFTGSFQGTVDFDPGAGEVAATSLGFWRDIFIEKLDLTGNYLWSYAAGGDEYDFGWELATTNDGQVFATGSFEEGMDFDWSSENFQVEEFGESDAYVVHLDSDGTLLDVLSIGGSSQENGSAIATDGVGNIYTGGTFRSNVCTVGDFELENAVPGDFAFDNYIAKFSLSDIPDFIGESEKNNLRVFPNPSEGLYVVDLSRLSGTSEITCFDATGKLLESFITSGPQLQLDLTEFSSGIYILKVINDSAVFTHQLVKEDVNEQ
jgi:Secretion system C-terminal sorting domain